MKNNIGFIIMQSFVIEFDRSQAIYEKSAYIIHIEFQLSMRLSNDGAAIGSMNLQYRSVCVLANES